MDSSIEWHNRFMQQAEWTVAARKYIDSKINLPSAEKILEVGCGTGAILFDIVQNTGSNSQIYGIDIDRTFILKAHTFVKKPVVCQSDGLFLPFENNTFSTTVCHFYLLWVSDPVQAVKEMKRVTQPDGWIVAFAEPDYAFRIDFPDELSKIGKLQADSLVAQGADPFIGRRLAAIFQQAGCFDIQVGLLGGEWGKKINQEEFDLEWQCIHSDLSHLLPATELTELKRIDQKAWEDRTRILYVPTFYALAHV
ncbi:MAG: methyltransferase domain-containing protein [Anaerolineaceae bacterium]